MNIKNKLIYTFMLLLLTQLFSVNRLIELSEFPSDDSLEYTDSNIQTKVPSGVIVASTDTVYIFDNVSINNSIFINNDCSIGGNVSIIGNNIISGNLSVGGISSLGGIAFSSISITGNEFVGGNLSITGLASIAGTLIAGCDLSVGCNVNIVDSTNATHGNILKAGSPFLHNFPGAANNNMFIGQNSGNFTTITGTNNIGIGTSVLQALTSGSNNTGLGLNSLNLTTTGGANTAIGLNALQKNTTGSNNVGVGQSTLAKNISGFQNVAIGNAALSSATGSQNVAIGYNALSVNTTGVNNTALGSNTLISNTTANFNTAIGDSVLNANVIGTLNTGVGRAALIINLGDNNTAVGGNSLLSNTTGNQNTGIGANTLNNTTTGSLNIALGYNAGSSLTLADNNNIDIGNTGTAGDVGVIRIGTSGTHTAVFFQGINGVSVGLSNGVLVTPSGQLGTLVSSKRYKANIKKIDRKSLMEKFVKIIPCSFSYKNDPESTKMYGMIAEELEEIMPELVIRDKDGNPETIAYHLFTPLLIAMIQEALKENSNLTTRIVELEKLTKKPKITNKTMGGLQKKTN